MDTIKQYAVDGLLLATYVVASVITYRVAGAIGLGAWNGFVLLIFMLRGVE